MVVSPALRLRRSRTERVAAGTYEGKGAGEQQSQEKSLKQPGAARHSSQGALRAMVTTPRAALFQSLQRGGPTQCFAKNEKGMLFPDRRAAAAPVR